MTTELIERIDHQRYLYAHDKRAYSVEMKLLQDCKSTIEQLQAIIQCPQCAWCIDPTKHTPPEGEAND